MCFLLLWSSKWNVLDWELPSAALWCCSAFNAAFCYPLLWMLSFPLWFSETLNASEIVNHLAFIFICSPASHRIVNECLISSLKCSPVWDMMRTQWVLSSHVNVTLVYCDIYYWQPPRSYFMFHKHHHQPSDTIIAHVYTSFHFTFYKTHNTNTSLDTVARHYLHSLTGQQ